MGDKNKSILIVEDEVVPADNLKEVLEQKGYAVIGICINGEEAVQKARETKPDLILMDIKLKGNMDGVEACERIHECLDVPVIYLTAYSDEKTLVRAEKTGPYGYIDKPFGPENVFNNVRMALSKHSQEREKKKEIEMRMEKFIAQVTHEIRNPLGVISGYLGLLKDLGATDQQIRYIQKIEISTDKAAALANDLLAYSKIKAGKFTMESEVFSIWERTNNIFDTYSRLFKEKGIEFYTGIAPDVPEYVSGDPGRLDQVLTNLLGNALKFTEKGFCSIDIRCEKTGKEKKTEKGNITLFFSVKDTGIGIPKDNETAVFEAFVQVPGFHTRKHGGTGLGLAITKQLVKMMGGEIWLESKPGEGTTFMFTAVFGPGEKWKGDE